MRFIKRTTSLALAFLLATSMPVAPPAASAATVAAAATVANLRAVAFVDPKIGVAVAESGVILRTTDGGESWTEVRKADTATTDGAAPDPYSFRGVSFWDATRGVAVEYKGRVAHTSDGGLTWTNVKFDPYYGMDDGGTNQGIILSHNDVACEPGGAAAIVAAGDDARDGTHIGATSMRTTGLPNHWQDPRWETKPHLSFDGRGNPYYVGEGEFFDIEYADAKTVWASGIDYWKLDPNNPEKYPLFRSVDGGVTYTKIPGFGTKDLRLDGVAFSGPKTGIVVGQEVTTTTPVPKAYYTTDGTATVPVWTEASLPGTAAPLTAVDMASPLNGWAVRTDGSIVRTQDGGKTWTQCTITDGNSHALHDVTFIPGTTTGWAVGASGTILLTTDGSIWRRPIPPPDTTPPAPPASLTATATGSSTISLTWSAASDPSGIEKYTVYPAGSLPIDVLPASTSHTVSGLAPSTAYTFEVTATDRAGNESARSPKASATTQAAPVTLTPVHRFYNRTNGTHFYTDTEAERQMVIATWPHVFSYEGIAYSVNPANNDQPLHRFYNKTNGSHFYTSNDAEAENVRKTWPHIYTYEGRTYAVSTVPAPGKTTVYRFYNLRNGSHFFTASEAEAENVKKMWSHVYKYEGAAFWLGQ
ncbi:MAG: YCF48-related protein [Coriobacteriia bacterium]